MDTASLAFSWWSAWRRRRAKRAAAGRDDPADMGTAFGLDATCEFDGDPNQARHGGGSIGTEKRRSLVEAPPVLESVWAARRLNGRSVI